MSAQTFVEKITSKREGHKSRSIIIRVITIVFGILLLVLGAPFLILFPEAGIPLVLVGLGFLSLEYTWAGGVLLWFACGVDRLIGWYRGLKRPVRYSIELFFLMLAIGITWLIFT